MTPTPGYSADECDTLLRVARESIVHGASTGRELTVDTPHFTDALRAPRATFVTLTARDALRGCIGALEAVRPLVGDVAHNAFAAAFCDPRFAPVSGGEVKQLHIHISILTPPEPFPVTSARDLLERLRPGIDGLILEEGWKHATFLPSVWESLPDPRTFVAHLKRKAGLDADYWSDRLRFKRYTTLSIGEEDNPHASAAR